MFTKIFGRREDRPAPPPLEELKKEAMGILSPDVFDGARFEFNKTLTQKFALNHNIFMGSSQLPSSYEFGANFGDERVLLASRTDMAGRLNGRVLAQLTDSMRFRAHAQMQPDSALPTHATFNVDYKGQDFASGLKYASGIMVGVEHMQSVTPNLALGGEYCQLDDSRGGKKIGSVAARCVWGPKEEHVATFKGGVLATLGSAEFSYQRKVSDKVGLATELNYIHNQMCSFGLGYEFRLRQATFKGLISSDTTCSAVLEERISAGVNLLLSGQLNHKKKDYKFGFGLAIGQG
jgi:mitochondrial import receptor subunit TOM40